MSYRMPFPVPFLPIILIAALASLAFSLILKTRNEAKRTHTCFLLNQINEVVATPSLPESKFELIQLLKHSDIDWNSCKLTSEELLDSWGARFHVNFDGMSDRLTIRSAGADKKFNTADDFAKTMQATKPAP
jgi:hypothetical protein